MSHLPVTVPLATDPTAINWVIAGVLVLNDTNTATANDMPNAMAMNPCNTQCKSCKTVVSDLAPV